MKASNELMVNLILFGSGVEFCQEYRFAPPRRWRFDFAFPDHRVAVEIEGATFAGGRHVRGAGYAKDCEKYNAAACLGWTVLRYTSDMLRDNPGRVLDDVMNIIKNKGGE